MNGENVNIEEKEPRKMTVERIREAFSTLQKYKNEKENLDAGVVAAEQWWRVRHWDEIDREHGTAKNKDQLRAKSAWLFNNIRNRHADFMDSMPTFSILPRELGDEKAAKTLTAIMPVILERCNFEGTYHSNTLAKCKQGNAVWGVFWDPDMTNLGDINITRVDVLNLFWKGGITDIQDSPNLFYVKLRPIRDIEREHPELKDKIKSSGNGIVSRYLYDDSIDTSDEVEVIDWYYKEGKILHLCTFVDDYVLYATEEDPARRDTGLYNHGMYPFHLDPLFEIAGTPAGFGYINVLSADQENTDVLGTAVINNAVRSAKRKCVVSKGASINLNDFADTDKEIVEAEGVFDRNSVVDINAPNMPGIVLNVRDSLISEMRETSGNNEVNSGGVPSGVTSGAAIAALQEKGGKTSRTDIKASYRVYANIIRMVIELIRQFYTVERTFRITGQNGETEYLPFSNKMMQGSALEDLNGNVSYIEPYFDIEVSAQKSSPYSQMAQNELAFDLYNRGFFAPQNADAALAALEIMDFKDKEKVKNIVGQNQTLYQTAMQLAQRVKQLEMIVGGRTNADLSAETPSSPSTAGMSDATLGGMHGESEREAPTVTKAKMQAAESAVPR